MTSAFNLLSNRVLNALRSLDSKALTRMSEEMAATVRQGLARGLAQNQTPTEIARHLREVIGLTPRQEEAVNNFRRSLEGDPRAGDPLDRALRDKRFDKTIARGDLSPDDVERMTEAYANRMTNYNADLNARTIAAESQRVGQRLAFQDAIESHGADVVVYKEWVHSGVPDEPRPEHLAMHGVQVPFDMPYPNGDMYPGEHDPWNCRCMEVYRVYPRDVVVAA